MCPAEPTYQMSCRALYLAPTKLMQDLTWTPPHKESTLRCRYSLR